MDKLFNSLIKKIFLESNFSLSKIEYIEKNYDFSTSVYIAQKPQGDYFIYLQLPEKLLPYVINDIQINLALSIKDQATNFDKISGDDVKISSSFDKNSTLIIFTTFENSKKNDVMKQVISIEEDPYFFKKQILLIPEKDLPVVESKFYENKSNYIAYIQGLISDTDRFNEFTSSNLLGMSSGGIEYSFVAKLYEKLPFLALLISPSNQEVLQKKIDGVLTEEQFMECNKLLEIDVNNLDAWFSEVVKEISDD